MALKRQSRANTADLAAQRGPLAAIVAARRQELGLSQVELGDLAGVSYRIVHNIEHGLTGTSLERTVAVLDTLGLHLVLERGRGDSVAASTSLAHHYGLNNAEAPDTSAGDALGSDVAGPSS